MDNINFDNNNNNSKQQKACGGCGSFDHTSRTCPNKPCFHCNEIGHQSSACEIVKEKKELEVE